MLASQARLGVHSSSVILTDRHSQAELGNEGTRENPTEWVDFMGLAKCDEFLENPKSIWGKSSDEIAEAFREEGYEAVIEQSTKGSKKSVQVRITGHPEITNIQVHPGGGRHEGAYYKISTSTQGKIKVVDPATYKPTPGEKAKIIYI